MTLLYNDLNCAGVTPCYCPQVDSQHLKHSTHLQAMQTLWNSGPVIKLFIQRKVSVASEGNLSFSESVLLPVA